jgi:hypothetical protein
VSTKLVSNKVLRERCNTLLTRGETLESIAMRGDFFKKSGRGICVDTYSVKMALGLIPSDTGKPQEVVTERNALRLATALLLDPVDIDL